MGRTVGNSSKIRLAISMISRDHNMAITISGRGGNSGFNPHFLLQLSSKSPPALPSFRLLQANVSSLTVSLCAAKTVLIMNVYLLVGNTR